MYQRNDSDVRKVIGFADIEFGGIDDEIPIVVKNVVAVTCPDGDLDRSPGPGESNRFAECSPHSPEGFSHGLPFTEYGVESPGIDQPVGLHIVHLEQVFPQVEGIDQIHPTAGPDRLPEDFVVGIDFIIVGSGMKIIQPQGLIDEIPIEGRSVLSRYRSQEGQREK